MRYWYDMSYEEIARATDSTASAVKSRLHRARVSLGAVLKGAEALHEQLPGGAQTHQPSAEMLWGTQAQWTPSSV